MITSLQRDLEGIIPRLLLKLKPSSHLMFHSKDPKEELPVGTMGLNLAINTSDALLHNSFFKSNSLNDFTSDFSLVFFALLTEKKASLEQTLTLKKDGKEDKEERKVIEAEVGETDIISADDSPQVNYSFHEERFIAGQFYNTPALDYVKMFYGEDKKAAAHYIPEEEYATTHAPDTERELLSASEAKELFMDMQYATVTGAASDINFDDRRKFNYWIMFNRALFGIFELEGVTREVNYAAY